MSSQLPLGLALQPQVDFAGFISGRNGEALARLQGWQDPFLYLWGEPGCGKSHLLMAACRAHAEMEQHCAYLPLTEIDSLEPAILEGLEDLDLVCLDDLQRLAGHEEWELALFNLFNRLRERDAQLVVTANQPPNGLPIKLPDLASRLTWGPCYQLYPLDDQQRQQLLINSARERGLEISPETAGFLLSRIPRDSHSLSQILEQLDQASLAAQRRLTIPFVREVLGL
jgi:DnaA family protein